MNYFTSTAYLVTAKISGRHGSYGATTSVVGVFNTKQRAESAMKEFIDNYNKGKPIGYRVSKSDIEIFEIKPCVIDEKIISKVYE